MADEDPKIPNEEQILKQLKESGSPPTRKTLIEKLDNWDDWASWDEFYRTYSNFVFHVARKAGLKGDADSIVRRLVARLERGAPISTIDVDTCRVVDATGDKVVAATADADDDDVTSNDDSDDGVVSPTAATTTGRVLDFFNTASASDDK